MNFSLLSISIFFQLQIGKENFLSATFSRTGPTQPHTSFFTHSLPLFSLSNPFPSSTSLNTHIPHILHNILPSTHTSLTTHIHNNHLSIQPHSLTSSYSSFHHTFGHWSSVYVNAAAGRAIVCAQWHWWRFFLILLVVLFGCIVSQTTTTVATITTAAQPQGC